MRNYISEARAMYEDANHGLFSEKLAQWAISRIEAVDPATGLMAPIKPRGLEEVTELVKMTDGAIPDEFMYTAWYLFNMCVADYPRTLVTDGQRAMFVVETITDPDGRPENVLDCFEAKMTGACIPVQWERFI